MHYIIKKNIYNIKSFFFKRKKQVAFFKDLKYINFFKKNVISEGKVAKSFFPKVNQNNHFKIVALNDIIAYNVINARVSLNSNALYIPKKNILFYEKWNDNIDDNISVYNSKFIIKHNTKKARFNHVLSNEKIKEAIYLGCTFPFNYYHFLLELVSRVAYLESIPNAKEITIILNQDLQKFESFIKIIYIFFKDYKIIFLNDYYIYDVENLWYITSPNTTLPNIKFGNKFKVSHTKINPESITFLRNKCINFVSNVNFEYKKNSRIFIKRKSDIRSYNQDEIEKIANTYNFESIYFEDLSFEEQVLMFHNADFIIGPTGAAWTNLIFAKQNAKGLIWMGNNWGDVSMYSTIAKNVNFDLNYFIFNCDSNNYHEKYFLNEKLFEDNLINLLKKYD